MKIRKIIVALILPGLLLAGLIGGKLVGKTHSSEVKATDANATLVGVYSADAFNNTEFGGGFNNVLITYTGEAHGLTDDPIKSADVLNKIKINGTTLTESGWGVIPWAGQLWFKIIHPSIVVSGDVLEIESGLTLGNATFGNSLHLKLNENSKWEVFVPEVAPNSTYSGIYSDSFNNTAKFDGYNQVLIVYDGVAHGLTGDITSQEVLNQISINGTPLTALAVTPWADQPWFNIIYPSSVHEGDILEVQNGFTLGAAVLKGFKLRLNSSLKWEYFPDDYGTIEFTQTTSDSSITGIFGVNSVENDLPAGWDSEAFHPVDENSGVFIGNERVGTEIKKVSATVYYIAVSGADVDTIATVKGTWKNSTAQFTVQEFTRQWNGEDWVTPIINYGEFVFDSANGDSTITNMYAINWTTNDLPAGWDTEAFTPADENSGTFINNVRVGNEIKKLGPNTYYVKVTGASVDSKATVKGTWKNSTAKFTVAEFTRQWNGTTWAAPIDDFGTITFDSANGDSAVNYMYGVCLATNDLPAGWDTEAFHPVDENSGVFMDNVRVGQEIKKIGPNTYYIAVSGASVDSIVTVKGTWKNSTAKFVVADFVRQWNGTAWTAPIYDYGTITFDSANGDSAVNYMYGVCSATNDLPAGWDTEAFHPVDENSGAFMNDVRVGTEIKKITANSYYIAVSGASVGSIVTVKGNWTNSSAKFAVNEFTRQWNGTTWELPLAEYDVISLADANIPDFPNGNINTEDAAGYGYTDDPAYLAKKRGVFGLTNDTESFAFEFSFETTDTMTDWFTVRIGASGGWVTGHYLQFQFTNIWNNGVLIVSERIDDVVYNGHTHEVQTDITTGGAHALEMGAVKVYNSNEYFVYFKNNGTIAYSTYWELSDAPRSTKIGLYAPDTCISILNTINPAANEVTLDAEKSTSTALYLNTASDLLAPVANWDEYFIPVEDGVKYNFVSVTADKWNYFKKPYAQQLYLDLSELGVSPQTGDILYVGGMFKMAHSNSGVLTAYKLNLADTYFEYDGNAWGAVSAERYQEILAHVKAEAKDELNALVDVDAYDATNLAIVQGIVNDAKSAVDAAILIEDVYAALQNAKDQIAAQAKTKLAIVEEAVMASDTLLDEYLESYDVVTTSDFSAVGGMTFLAKGEGGYSSGGYDDTTTRFISSSSNYDGNVIFQFNYESTDPSANLYGSQIFIRMRGNDSDCYRFEIANDMGNGEAGVGISVLNSDVATQRKTYNANFAANTSYKIECGSIDLAGYARTLLFIKINDQMVLKEIVDQVSDQIPAIRIMDSYTGEGAVTRLTPIEAGTTKSQNNPALLGRLILDESSNKASLYATLGENALPEDAVLFPLESGAFTINGAEVSSWRSVTNIRKISANKYRIEFDSSELADGAVVHIGGYYSYLDSELVKSGYRFFDAEFIYHASTDSWTQSVPTDRETLIYEAKETLMNYANLDDYSAENQQRITEIVNQYLVAIEEAETEQIQSVLREALALIDAIPTIFDEYKSAAKAELASYRSADLYRDEEKAELASILETANAQIDAASDKATVDAIVANAKAAIDELKTAEQRDAEDLAAKKKSGKSEINALSSLLEMDRYSDENQTALSNLTYKAIEDIDKATSEAEIDSIVAKYKADIMAVETKDGSTFDGSKYVGGNSGEQPDEGEEENEEQEQSILQKLISLVKKFVKKVIEILRNIYHNLSGKLQQ